MVRVLDTAHARLAAGEDCEDNCGDDFVALEEAHDRLTGNFADDILHGFAKHAPTADLAGQGARAGAEGDGSKPAALYSRGACLGHEGSTAMWFGTIWFDNGAWLTTTAFTVGGRSFPDLTLEPQRGDAYVGSVNAYDAARIFAWSIHQWCMCLRCMFRWLCD